MKKIYVPLFEAERDALVSLAQYERRDPRAQAALLIRQSLERLGLLPPPPITPHENDQAQEVQQCEI